MVNVRRELSDGKKRPDMRVCVCVNMLKALGHLAAGAHQPLICAKTRLQAELAFHSFEPEAVPQMKPD